MPTSLVDTMALFQQEFIFFLQHLTKFLLVEIKEKIILGLPDKKLYPTVSAVYGNTEVSMVYLGAPLDG